jgi:ureidoglycolate lyase
MKIVRYGPAGAERPGLIDPEGRVRSLWPLLTDIDARALTPELLAVLKAIDPMALPLAPHGARLGAPVGNIRQILAVAVNYADHGAERGNEVPAEPVVFHKSVGSLSGPTDPIVLPPDTVENDWEIELGILIGSRAKRVSESEASACVAGYCLLNDVTERHWQHKRSGQLNKGKSFDTFTPIGPWLLTADSVEDPQALDMWLDLNGVRRQEASTSQMIYGVAKLVSYISQFMTLEPGDLIASGTPAGVGAACKPPVFLQAGDRLEFGITGLGEQSHAVVRDPSDAVVLIQPKSAVG